jgi:hypothetical protein
MKTRAFEDKPAGKSNSISSQFDRELERMSQDTSLSAPALVKNLMERESTVDQMQKLIDDNESSAASQA